MSDLKAFLKESAVPVENIMYVASERFKGSDGQAVEWELKPLSSDEFDDIMLRAKKKVADPADPRNKVFVTDNSKVRDDILVAAVVSPNLRSQELQESWGTVGELATLKGMLLPGELADLSAMIQQISGFEVGMEDKIKTAKN